MKRIYPLFSFLLVVALSLPITFAQPSHKDQPTQQDKTEQVVYVTKTGSKYHSSSCGYLHSSKIKTTLKSAKNNGYTACSKCKGGVSYSPTKSTSNSSVSVRCSGTTKSGSRCKRMTTSSSRRCYQH